MERISKQGPAHLAITYPILGALPSKMQKRMGDGFNATVGTLVSGTAEFIVGFSLLFMLVNGVFTSYFILSSGVLSVFVLAFLLIVTVEGLYRIFFVILDKGDSKGSVLYWIVPVLHGIGYTISSLLDKIPKPKKMTEEERKQKEIAENFKKFIEYGMDQPAGGYSRQ